MSKKFLDVKLMMQREGKVHSPVSEVYGDAVRNNEIMEENVRLKKAAKQLRLKLKQLKK